MPAAIWGGMNKSQPVVATASCNRQQQLSAAARAAPPHLQHGRLDHVPLVHVPRQAHVVHAQHRQLALRNNQGSRQRWACVECHTQGRQLPSAAHLQEGRARALQPRTNRHSRRHAAGQHRALNRCNPLEALPTNTQQHEQQLLKASGELASKEVLLAGGGGGGSPRAPTRRPPAGWQLSTLPSLLSAGSTAA